MYIQKKSIRAIFLYVLLTVRVIYPAGDNCTEFTTVRKSGSLTPHPNQQTNQQPDKGYFACGIPFNRLGNGPRTAVVFQGLVFENKPQADMMVGMYRFLDTLYSVYVAARKPGLPQGYTLENMADDYADMIRDEFGGPVDIIGVSTGGSIALHFAADHPDLIRRLVIQSSAYTLSEESKALQLKVADLAKDRHWIRSYAAILGYMAPHNCICRIFSSPLVWLGALVAGILEAPENPDDLVITVEAEDKLNFKERLSEITVPTLIVAGEADPFYPVELFRETAEGIPECKLILYPKMGHPAKGKQFERDVVTFFTEIRSPSD